MKTLKNILHDSAKNLDEIISTYRLSMTEVMSVGMIHLWLGFLMGNGCCNLLDSTLNGCIINSW
jgi:hypothetical protein